MKNKNIKEIDPQIISGLNYDTVEEAGIEMLFLQARSKLSEYKSQIEEFEKKYNMPFELFQKKIQQMVNEEDFDEEDDLMEWQYAYENKQYWQKKIKELERCL